MASMSESEEAGAVSGLRGADSSETPSPQRLGAETSSRAVRYLSKDSRDKKRANDREAQRNLRRKIKEKMENLERENRELRSGEAYRNLDSLRRKCADLQQDNMALREKLLKIRAETNFEQPSTDPGSLERSADLRAYTIVEPAAAPQDHRRNTLEHAYTTIEATSPPYVAYASSSSQNVPSCPQDPRHSQSVSSHLINPRLMGRIGSPGKPIWAQMPNNTGFLESCKNQDHWDRQLAPFVHEKRDMLRRGFSEYDTLGPPRPNFAHFFDFWRNPKPERLPQSPIQFAIALVSCFGIKDFKARVGAVANVYAFLRWYIAPTEANYVRMPAYMRPTREQLEIPHPLWMDYPHWPQMRRELCLGRDNTPINKFCCPYSQTLQLEWNKPNSAVLEVTEVLSDGFLITMTMEYEAQNNMLTNWTLGEYFDEKLPELKSTHAATAENLAAHFENVGYLPTQALLSRS